MLGRDGGSYTINKNLETDDLAHLMRQACPVPGDSWSKYMRVVLQPGEQVKPHAHKRHAVLYYPEPASCVTIYPQPGTLLYLPPGTLHEVSPVKFARLSIAMLVDG